METDLSLKESLAKDGHVQVRSSACGKGSQRRRQDERKQFAMGQDAQRGHEIESRRPRKGSNPRVTQILGPEPGGINCL